MVSRFDKFEERKGYDHNLFGMRTATRTDTNVLAVFEHSLNFLLHHLELLLLYQPSYRFSFMSSPSSYPPRVLLPLTNRLPFIHFIPPHLRRSTCSHSGSGRWPFQGLTGGRRRGHFSFTSWKHSTSSPLISFTLSQASRSENESL